MSLDAYLKENGIVGIQGLDTRALTRHLRDNGAQNGIISTVDFDPESLVKKARAIPAWPDSISPPASAPISLSLDTGAVGSGRGISRG